MSDNSRRALSVAMVSIGGSAIEKIQALIKIRELVCNDETVNGTDQRNKHPAFKAVLTSLNEVKEPNLFDDLDANENGKYNGVMNASNIVGIIASLSQLLEDLKSENKTDEEIINNPDVKCIISQCRHLAEV